MQSHANTWVEAAKARPVCCIGQHSPADMRALSAAVRSGELVKRRAPFAGGFGAMKTYYAASDVAFGIWQTEQVAHFGLCQMLDNANRRAAQVQS